MKKIVMMIAALTALNAAHADGFVCQTVEGDLNVKIYNHVDPSVGTRVASIMVLSDPGVSIGRKTIARFTEVQENLSSIGANYEANVDLRFSDSSRKGEIVAGTKLGQLQTIHLNVDFSYSSPIEAGEEVPGLLTLVKRNGDEITRDVECTRYLKN
jgi:hypothetical protein